MNDSQNIQNILNALKIAIKQPTLELKRKKINPIINTLETIINNINVSSSNYENIYKKIQMIAKTDFSELQEQKKYRAAFKKAQQIYYAKQKNQKSLSDLKNEALADLKEGYKAIQKIRTELTNEEIIYNFLLTSLDYRLANLPSVVTEINISFEQLQPRLTIAYDETNGILIKILGLSNYFKNNSNDDVTFINISSSSSLLSATWRFYHDERMNPTRIKSEMTNGNFWEAYKYLYSISPYEDRNSWIPDEKTLVEVFSRVILAGGGVQGAFNKGGDTLQPDTNKLVVQNKAADANLTGKNAIVNQLSELKRIFSQIANKDIDFSALQKYFVGNRSYSNKAYQFARTVASDAILNKFKEENKN